MALTPTSKQSEPAILPSLQARSTPKARAAAQIVRETLKAEGLIANEDHELTRLGRLELEGLELRDPLHDQPGRVIVFHTKAKGGFKAGQKWEVCEPLAGGRFKLRRDSVTRDFDPSQRGKWPGPSSMTVTPGITVTPYLSRTPASR